MEKTLMTTSDSFLVFINSSLQLNFAVLVSKDDNISSLKKKAEAQHLNLFPLKGTIVAHAIKVMREEIVYYIPDSIPVRLLFDKAEGTHSVFMDAEVVSSNRAGTSQDNLHVSNKKGLHDSLVLSPDAAVVGVIPREEEENQIGGEEHVPIERQSQDAVFEGICNEKERSIALEKEARKEVEDNWSAENAVLGEASSLAPKGSIDPGDGLMIAALTSLKGNDRDREGRRSKKSGERKTKKSQGKSNLTTDSRVASDEKKRPAMESVGDGSEVSKGKKQKVVSEVVPDELRCRRDGGGGWRCPNEALPGTKFCYRHSTKKSPQK